MVSPGVFAQIVSELEGEPFFPNLTTLHIVDLENFLKQYPFLLSQKIERVSAVLPNLWVKARAGIGAFIHALIAFAPEIRFLSITLRGKKTLEVSHISAINRLTCLRSLEISRLGGIKGTVDIFLFLKALVQLEELQLTIGDSVQTWCPAQKACISSTPGVSNLPIGAYLKSLQSLSIKGPSQIISEFLDFLGTSNLVSLSLASTCWLHAQQSAQLHNEPLNASERQTQTSNQQPSDLQPAEVRSQACVAACTSAPHRHEWTLTRWSNSLEKLTISSCDKTIFDFSSISKHEALKSLDIKGGITPITELLSSGAPGCNPLHTLSLSSPDTNLTLFELEKIAKRAPNLLKLSSSFYIGGDSELDSLAKVEPLTHPLEELTMPKAIFKDVGSSTFLLATKIAERLHVLFPNLKRLNYPPDENTIWGDVWHIVQLCQKIALYEQRRHTLAMDVSEAGVMTDGGHSSPNSGLELDSADCKLRE